MILSPQQHARTSGAFRTAETGPVDAGWLGKGLVSDRTLAVVMRMVERSGLIEMLHEVRAEHAAKVGPGGRPLIVPTETAIVLLALMPKEADSATRVTHAADMVMDRLSAEQRERLGLPARRADETRRLWVDRIHAALDSFFRLLDPYFSPDRRRRLPREEYDAFVATRDPEDVAKRTTRLYAVMNGLVQASVQECPQQYLDNFKGDRAVDGTSWRISAEGPSEKDGTVSVEPCAGFYDRNGTHKADSAATAAMDNMKPYFAYEGTIFIRTKARTSDPDDLYPNLIDGVGLNAPGVAPAETTVAAAETIHRAGLPIGLLRGDKNYWAHQKVVKFHRHMWRMGFEAVTGYRQPDLGYQGEIRGSVVIDGDLYCQAIMGMPLLINATDDFLKDKIDFETLQARLEQRAKHLVPLKGRPKPGGSQTRYCQASLGEKSRTDCNIKTAGIDLPPGRLLLPFMTPSGDVCLLKRSVTIAFEERSKFEQPIRFMTREWFDAMGQRNVVECTNKDLKETALGNQKGFRLRGFAANFLHLALCTMSLNVERIRKFVRDVGTRNKAARARRAARRGPVPSSATAKQHASDLADEVFGLANEPDPDPPPRK